MSLSSAGGGRAAQSTNCNRSIITVIESSDDRASNDLYGGPERLPRDCPWLPQAPRQYEPPRPCPGIPAGCCWPRREKLRCPFHDRAHHWTGAADLPPL